MTSEPIRPPNEALQARIEHDQPEYVPAEPGQINARDSDVAGERAERRWMLTAAALTMLLTLFPYLIGWSLAQGRQFMWLGYNLDDSCQYLSWMRQSADGSFLALNLFTTDPQHGMLLNPFFLVLGRVAGLTGLPLLAVYHLARLACGFGLLLLVWAFLKQTVTAAAARRLAFLCVCFASGLGWLPVTWTAPGPIDTWQPEAITFLSLYLSPLFCFSMALQMAILLLLQQGEITGRCRFAVGAGICGFVLGLTHTYDIVSLSAVWTAYLLVTLLPRFLSKNAKAGKDRQVMWQSLLRAALAGALTLPAVVYIYHELKTEAIFQQRANVVTAAPPPLWEMMGYGLTLAFAVYAVSKLRRGANRSHGGSAGAESLGTLALPETKPASLPSWFSRREAATLLITWAVMNVLVSYLPVNRFPFQRKMLQGAHFPIAILAGVGLAWLLAQPAVQRHFKNTRLAAGAILFLLSLTNIWFVAREVANYRENKVQTFQHRPYLNPGELEALQWVRTHTPAGAAIQPLPWVARVGERSLGPTDMSLACFTPGLTHHKVYCGHWGETPDYGAKLQELIRFMRPDRPESERVSLLRKMNVQYLLFSQRNVPQNPDYPFHPLLSDPISVPSYLKLVYSNKDADVYQIDESAMSA